MDEVFHSEDAARIDEYLGEEHQHRAVYLTFRRQQQTGGCHCCPKDEKQQGGDFLGHVSPKADRMAVREVRITLTMTDHLFFVSCVMGSVVCRV